LKPIPENATNEKVEDSMPLIVNKSALYFKRLSQQNTRGIEGEK
jgi:hypothetical protein